MPKILPFASIDPDVDPGVLKSRLDRPRPRFAPISISDLLAGKPQGWLLKGVIAEESLAVIYGDSSAGKTFLVLDFAMAMARGQAEWLGRRIKPGPVIYVAGEGGGGLRKRVEAYLVHRLPLTEPQPAHFRIETLPPNLFEGDAEEFASAIAAYGPVLVILDTLARTAVGAEESSARDMGKYVEAADFVRRQLRCAVLIIHHAGLNGNIRGSTALRAGCDTVVEVKRHANSDTRELVLGDHARVKIKDGRDDQKSIFFRLEEVVIGADEDGDVITSCIVRPTEASQPAQRPPLPRGERQKLIYSLAAQLAKQSKVSAVAGAPAGRPVVGESDLLKGYQAAAAGTKSAAPSYFRETFRKMVKDGVLCEAEGFVWFP